MDGAPACPFVAFGDDRDGRSTSPDHRHRCFAESPPAPRALAHQEAYCLSSAFPVCPTFQDWARREAAHARGAGDRAETAPSAVPAAAIDDAEEETVPPRDPADPPVRRNPPRDWAAPPPWAVGAAGAAGAAGASGAGAAGVRAGSPEPSASEFLSGRSVEGQGLAGSAADRLAGAPPPSADADPGSAGYAAAAAGAVGAAAAIGDAAPHEDLAGLAQGRPATPQTPARTAADGYPPSTMTGKRPTVSSTRTSGDVIAGPAWEGPRRSEAYPTIRSRASMPGLPRIAVLAGALGIAALALFMLPALLGIGGGGPSASSSPSQPVATPSAEITPVPAPSAQVYVIKQKDTLSKVAKRFGLTIEELLAANPEIKNPDKISIGQQIIIPLPSGDGTAPSASAAP